mgnify:CR=1 FL=1
MTSYPYILITNEKHPRLLVVREELSKKKGKFFGPYPNVSSARKTQELLNKLYPFRKCHKIPNKECLYYHMHQCLAPCINHLDMDYSKYINEVSDFLKGNTKGVTSELESKMMDASLNLEFEKALEYRDLLNDIKSTTEKQKIANNDLMAHDVIGIYSSLDEVSIEDGTRSKILNEFYDKFEALFNVAINSMEKEQPKIQRNSIRFLRFKRTD